MFAHCSPLWQRCLEVRVRPITPPPTHASTRSRLAAVAIAVAPAQVKAAFKVFEKDAPNGFVTMAALEQALTTYGTEKLSLSDAQELLSQIEPDENGLINYVEFVNMMTSS